MFTIHQQALTRCYHISYLPRISHYFGWILLLFIAYSCQQENQGDPLEPVSEILARDNGNRGNASDIEVNFDKQFSTTPIEVYRIFVLKSGQQSVQDLDFLQSLSAEYYTEVAPKDIFPVQGKFLREQMLDTDGDPIVEGPAYRVAAISLPINSKLFSPSVGYSEEDLILSQNGQVRPYSAELDAGAGSLVLNDQGILVMSPYDVVTDLSGGGTRQKIPIHYFSSPTSFNTSEESFDFLGGSAFDSQGNLYLPSPLTNEILKVSPDGWIEPLIHFGESFKQPDAIFINAQDEMFVADREDGRLIRISPEGFSFWFTNAETNIRGLTGDEAGNLYASVNKEEGWILKITPEGVVSKFAQIPTFVPPDYNIPFASWIGYLTYHQGNLYVASPSTDRIYKVDATGTVSVFAGSGTRLIPEGDALTANFNRPMGLVFSADGNRLYVSGCTDTAPQHTQASRPSRIYQIEIR